MRPEDSSILFLTNYRGGGIGDFGTALGGHLASRLGPLRIVETSVDGGGFLSQSFLTATYPGAVIANIGLTAWGRSGIRNFSGFASVGRHASRGGPTIAFVHHAIEMLEPEQTGFPVTRAVEWGAHLALRQLRKCGIVVFTPRLCDLLKSRYSAQSVWLVPLPGNPCRRPPTEARDARPKIVTAGYWAPYKGIDLFLDLAQRLGPGMDFVLAGRPHRLLSRDSVFAVKIDQWATRAKQLNVSLPGFLSPEGLDSVLFGKSIGVLPYTSASGASASFQMFAERGIPVVASDLPEFRYLGDCGAGILVGPPTVESLAEIIGKVLQEPQLWTRLVAKQVAFSHRFGWESFTDELVTRFHLRPNRPLDPPGIEPSSSGRESET
jgi:glycosyltransferase involved in cell wall biosynthesis